MNKLEKRKKLKAFENALHNSFTKVRNLTHKFDLPEALIKQLNQLEDRFMAEGKAAIKAEE